MFTRFKALSVAVIFVFSLVFLTILFSNDGILAGKSVQNRLKSIQEEVKQKENDLSSLRYRASRGAGEKAEGEVLYSFQDERMFDPVESSRTGAVNEDFHALSFLSIFLLSLLITVLYGAIIFAVIPLIGRRRGKKNG